ncbi:MAG TPA: PHB depolymerase family esterase [Gemmatimonadales bacterium]|nr:PHB depolymerase family esterase [Gemmatimonadales bacterium]
MTLARGVLGALAAILPPALPAQRVETGFLDRTVTVANHTYRYQVYVPATYSTAQPWPVILFLHGAGERGADGLLQTNVGLGPAIRSHPSRYPAIVVFPQAPAESLWTGTPADVALAALDATLREYRTDPDRVYLTGLSMGGNGTWYLAYRYPDRFAAIAPVCGFVTAPTRLRGATAIVPPDSGAPFPALARRLLRLPAWIFHGEVDPVVPVAESRRAADALRDAGSPVRYTEVLGGGHDIWDRVYGSPQFQDWLFAQRRAR